MNRYFIPGEGPRDFPRRSYARIDQVEPINPEGAPDVVISFDAVDATWKGFHEGSLLNLNGSDQSQMERARFWSERFSRDPGQPTDELDPYEEVPLYQIELTLPRDHEWLRDGLLAGDWLEIDLDDRGDIEVDVYGGMFQEPVLAYISHAPRPAMPAAVLSAAFDMTLWPDATQAELDAALPPRCDIEKLVMFDVGQGSACALICQCGFPTTYFDVGCGVYRNAATSPPSVRFCVCDNPTIILSHWDSDHWAGALKDTTLQQLVWVAPRQTISPKHTTFGNSILKAGGRILIVPINTPPISWTSGAKCELRRCTGPLSDRNASGMALIVEDPRSGRSWLLTGDAAYDKIPPPLPTNFAAVVVPHHGADMGSASIPPIMSCHHYTRLLYSFGPGNAHGKMSVRHPTQAAMDAHVLASWPHGAWLPSSPGDTIAGVPVLATAAHHIGHQGGVVTSWTSPATLTGHLSTCVQAMPVTQS